MNFQMFSTLIVRKCLKFDSLSDYQLLIRQVISGRVQLLKFVQNSVSYIQVTGDVFKIFYFTK